MAKDDCICMIIGWPDTYAKSAEKIFTWFYDIGVIKDPFFKAGHASMCIIHKESKEIEYFDFGRYTSDEGLGRARGKNTDPHLEIKVKARIDENGKLGNLQELVDFLFTISRFTHGEGVIYFSLYDKMNYAKTIKFIDDIQQKGSMPYTTFLPNSTNCARFVCGALLAGSSVRRDKVRLLITPFIRASPIGNAIDVGYQSNIYRQRSLESPLENFKMTRWDNVKLLWSNMVDNLKGEKKIYPEPPQKPIKQSDDIPENAHWLAGLGEGNWISITPLEFDGQTCFRAVAQYEDGLVNYDTIVKAEKEDEVDPSLPFEVAYDCSRLFVSIKQNGKKIRLYWLKDYQDVNKNLIRKLNTSISTWT